MGTGRLAGGRPREHDREALKPVILERLAAGELVIDITADLGLVQNAPYLWGEEDPEFQTAYARARIHQAHCFAERTLKIADGSDLLTLFRKKAIEQHVSELEEKGLSAKILKAVVNGLTFALINRDRLRVDSLKWFTSKIAPKLYGDKLDITSGDKPLAPAQQTMAIEFVSAGALPEKT